MIPCKDCLLIPVCRLKAYRILMKDCELLRTKLYILSPSYPLAERGKRDDNFDELLIEVVNLLNPTRWHLGPQMYGDIYELRIYVDNPADMYEP